MFWKTKRNEPFLHEVVRHGKTLAYFFPESDLISGLTNSANPGIFTPVTLSFDGEPDCFFEGEGEIPYRGQDAAKELLTLEVCTLGEVSPRIKTLLTGPAGTGKTTLAHILVQMIQDRHDEVGMPEGAFYELLPAQVKDKVVLDQFMQQVASDPYATVFIDEVHELQNLESLFRVLQDGEDLWYPMSNGQRLPVANTISWVMATTDPGKLDSTTGGAMRRRVEPEIRLEEPTNEQLAQIILDSGKHDGRAVHPDAAYEMAERSLFPWQAKRIYLTALKVAVSEKASEIDPHHATSAFRMLDLDARGLLKEDRAVLRALFQTNGGRGITLVSDPTTTLYKLSMDNLCAMAGVDTDTYKKRIQPKLMRLGLLTTRGGQCLTDRAIEQYGHLRTT